MTDLGTVIEKTIDKHILGGAWPYNGPQPLPKEMEILRARITNVLINSIAEKYAADAIEAKDTEIEQLTDALGQANIDVANMAGEVSTFAEPCQTDGCQFARAEAAEAVVEAATAVAGTWPARAHIGKLVDAITAYDKVREGK